MNDLTLYQLTNGFMQVYDAVENGEITEELAKEIQDELQTALTNKSANIIAYYQNKQTLINGIDEEIKRLQEFKKSEKTKLDNYKEYVKNNMEVLGIEKIETPVGKLTIAKSPISVEIINENEIPSEYKTVVTETKVDKKKIADNFKTTGEIIAGVNIITNNTNLRVK